MKRLTSILAILVAGLLCVPGAAQAAFGLNNFKVTYSNQDGSPATQAGSHPFAMTTSFGVNFSGEGAQAFTDGRIKDAALAQIAGLAGDATAYPRCSTADFLFHEGTENHCPADTAVGVIGNAITEPGTWYGGPVFNLVPPPGVVVRLGFRALVEDIVVDVGVNPDPPYNPVARVHNAPQIVYIYGNKTQLWGNPSDPAHDGFRGNCYGQVSALEPGEEFEFEPLGSCSAPPRGAFLTLPTRCSGQNLTSFAGDAYEHPGRLLANGEPDLSDPAWVTGGAETPPFTGCGRLGFNPSITAKPTSRAAQSPTGLDFALDVRDEGLSNPEGLSQSDIKKAVVTLPEGMTANPSLAEGLAVCSESDLARETLTSAPGEGCPEASKIGTIEVQSPLVEEALTGSLYVATPNENLAENSFIALYMVIENRNLGVIVKQPAKVTPDPKTGQLVTTTDNIPQLPFSHFKLHFREGGRSPLISPPGCGSFDARAELTPWSGGAPVVSTSTFQIVTGPQEGACPPGGVAPFHPGFEAGSLGAAAGRYSPFYMRLSRRDGEQDMTKFSAVLPAGVSAKLAGVGRCSDAAIATAKANIGLEERVNPSCPSSSQIGRTVAGAGVGSQLTFVPGSLYLAGPYHGDPLSVVAITPAVAGPFDAGTVVVREALTVNPKTAVGEVDGAASDPIPHILKGIPLNVRELQIYADRSGFTLNPTSCALEQARATLFGSFLAPLDPSDDVPVGLSAPYQAVNCAKLGFKPKLDLTLKGGTKRGKFPKLRGTYTPREGDANLKTLVLRLPQSAFLEQGHFGTICTRVQYAAKACPEKSVYGHARAFTPLLSEPLEGPVYLRSSNHNLPDLVASLHGLVDVEAIARIDSKNGGIRATFAEVPDAPLTKVVVNMLAGKKGLIVNSTNLCTAKHHADARFDAQSGKRVEATPLVRATGCKKHKRKHKGH